MSGIDQVHHFHNAAVAPGVTEQPLLFECDGEQLLGVLALAQQPGDCGVLIIVGGPQYRAGSHRQFVLLARKLAAAGYSSLRFDYRGMGDSSGSPRDFRHVGADIEAAVSAFLASAPQLKRIVLFGLCDAASAALMYGADLKAVTGMVLINPWVRDDVSFARVQVKHYYGARLFNPAFWSKLLRGEVDYRATGASLAKRLRTAFAGSRRDGSSDAGFQDAMARGLRRFKRPVLLILSGKDLTAQEFRDYTANHAAWRGLLGAPHITRFDLADADHTFSRQHWRAQIESALIAWLQKHYAASADADMERITC